MKVSGLTKKRKNELDSNAKYCFYIPDKKLWFNNDLNSKPIILNGRYARTIEHYVNHLHENRQLVLPGVYM